MCLKRNSKTVDIVKPTYEGRAMIEKTVRVDGCLKNLIHTLNTHGIKTLACCCGHHVYHMTIVYEAPDGKAWELLHGVSIPRKARFYVKDKQGLFYIPETIGK